MATNKRIRKKRLKRAIAKNSVLCFHVMEETMSQPSFTSRIFGLHEECPSPPKPITDREFKTAWRRALKGVRLQSKWGW